ncbi:hypothetical protein BCR37DRAFT_392789 [Protomyces lactucae-debilis]|uniref:Uncharacterized protein n=1 Tax=Protomyces lactucae-debilis TaxID=2754530 RepID=A0A1Y2FF74_PROLT|nr:uncharacterized protein BCR37DRAFT_392789 [Protomyces lactucae-debilis]ORY82583.1 hypothetical protein BCR37DRAFT_392789 [Protomyces lactucae-debilis]
MLSRQGQRPQTPFAYASVHPALRGSFASLHYSTRLPYPDLPVTSAMMQSSDSLSVLSLISLTQFAQFEAQLSVKSIESMVLHYGAASVRGMHKPLPVPVQTPEHKEAQPTGLKHWMGTLKLRAKTLLGRKAPEKENLPPSYDCKLQQATRPPLTSLFASSLSSINNPFEEHNEGFSKIWRDSEGVRYLCVEQVEPSLQQRDAFWQLRIEAMRYGKVIPIPVKNIMKRCRSKSKCSDGLWTIDGKRRIWLVQRIC